MRSTGAAIIRDGLGSTSISTKLEAARKHRSDMGGGLSFLDPTHPWSMYLNPTLSIINYAASRVFCPFEDKIPGCCKRTANDLDSASCMPHLIRVSRPFYSCVFYLCVHGSRAGRCSRLPESLEAIELLSLADTAFWLCLFLLVTGSMNCLARCELGCTTGPISTTAFRPGIAAERENGKHLRLALIVTDRLLPVATPPGCALVGDDD